MVFDPLDGSRNIECAVPTGGRTCRRGSLVRSACSRHTGRRGGEGSCISHTLELHSASPSSRLPLPFPAGSIFGVYRRQAGADLAADVLQPGCQLVAAGYSLYSSATMMVVSVGKVRRAAAWVRRLSLSAVSHGLSSHVSGISGMPRGVRAASPPGWTHTPAWGRVSLLWVSAVVSVVSGAQPPAPAPASHQGTHGFTLDPLLGEWVLSHPAMACPHRGQIYSVNDARYFDWPKGLQKYIDTIRQVRRCRRHPLALVVVVLHPPPA